MWQRFFAPFVWIYNRLRDLLVYPRTLSSDSWMAIFNGLLVLFTLLLVGVSYRTDETSRKSQRAYVSFEGLNLGRKITDPTTHKLASVVLFAIWTNSGDTPTKHSRMHYSFLPTGYELPPGFNFIDLGDQKSIPFVLGPKATVATGEMIIPVPALLAVQQGAHLYIWGWVTYHDIFDEEKLRVSEFCSDIVNVTGDVTDPNANISITPTLCQEHNCFDEECKAPLPPN
jgi:hypothetical protein